MSSIATSLIRITLWLVLIKPLKSSLSTHFRYYEELTAEDMKLGRVKRSTSHNAKNTLTFSAHNRNFIINLFPDFSVLSDDFTVYIIHSESGVGYHKVNKNDLFTGFVKGNQRHTVDAVRHGDLWIMRIQTGKDVYFVEPQHRFTPHIAGVSNRKMVIYKQSDLIPRNSTQKPFCQETYFHQVNSSKLEPVARKDEGLARVFDNFKKRRTWSRAKRTTHLSGDGEDTQDTCDIFGIIDHTAFAQLGRGSVEAASKYIAFFYKSVDRLFRDTEFIRGKRYGIRMTALTVYTKRTETKPFEKHFNNEEGLEDPLDLLRSMTQISEFSHFCLIHLTVARKFGGTLGVATIPSPKSSTWDNGICATTSTTSMNIGFSTVLDQQGHFMPSQTYVAVLAHELGHNFGSNHDPNSAECAPDSNRGGKYLMWDFVSSGKDHNYLTFSPCSIRSIGKVLKNKSYRCFLPSKAITMCGDGLVSVTEDCDTGTPMSHDPCCSNKCRFREGAVCSPYNLPCCTDKCQVAPSTQKCYNDIENDCVLPSNCSGVSALHCPAAILAPNGTPCKHNGTCWHGRCMSFCEALVKLGGLSDKHLEPCQCDSDPKSMCLHCCRDRASEDQKCVVMGGQFPEGAPCLLGYCSEGTCLKVTSVELALMAKSPEHEHESRSKLILLTVIVTLPSAIVTLCLLTCFVKKVTRAYHLRVLKQKLESSLGSANQPFEERNEIMY